jgi:Dolichyl-phosphate-mannose-protein mannosyltransferase
LSTVLGRNEGSSARQVDRIDRKAKLRRPSSALCISILVIAAVAGIAIRAWYLAHDHIDSDAAVAGLMAKNILSGHFRAFFWGQDYGGVEPYVIAIVFALFGQSALTLGLAPVILTIGTVIITYRIALRLVRDPMLAALAGAVVWVAPEIGAWNSTIEYGFRSAALFFGVLSLLLSLHVLDGRRTYLDFVALGLAVGLSWWASPETVYLLVPSAAIVVGAILKDEAPRFAFWLSRLAALVVAFALGALPWLWSNLLRGFPSLHISQHYAVKSDYLDHLRIFFVEELPLQLGLHRLQTGAPVISGTPGKAVEVIAYALVVALILLCLIRPGRAQVIGAATLAFPFLYAASPLAWFWNDGRYGVYLPILLALTAVSALQTLQQMYRARARRHDMPVGNSFARWFASALCGAAIVLSSFAFLTMPSRYGTSLSTYAKGWSSPDGDVANEVDALLHAGVRFGYANYWVAYVLDFVSHGQISVSPLLCPRVQYPPLYQDVHSSGQPAWLFVPATDLDIAFQQFGMTNVEIGSEPEKTFLEEVTQQGIPFRIVRAGILNAVVPSRPITPRSVGIRGCT